MLQCRDTETAAAEYSHMMRCHDDSGRSSVCEVVAKSAGSRVGVLAGVACTCVNVYSPAGFARRFSSPARTAYHVNRLQENSAAVAG